MTQYNAKIRNLDQRRINFFILENSIVDREDLTVYEKVAYVVLVRYANTQDTCYPSVKTISEKCGCSERKIKDVLKSLQDKKLIDIEPRYLDNGSQTSNLYVVLSSDNLD